MMHKAPSSPALSRLENDYLTTDGGSPSTGGRESLADLWQSFLEQESGSGNGSEKGGKSRTASTSIGVGLLSPGLPPPSGK